MSEHIWRLTNNGTASTGTGVLGEVAADAIIDIPADKVTVLWKTDTPFSNTGSNGIDRMYIADGTTNVREADTDADQLAHYTTLNTTGSENIAKAELITDHGFGASVYSESAS